MVLSVSLRRWSGHGCLTFLAMVLLTLFAIHILANTFRKDVIDSSSLAEESRHEGECGSGGFWDICCRTSRSSPSGSQGENAIYRPAPGQMPIVPVSHTYSTSDTAEDSSSSFTKHTMKLVQPLLASAAEAWCSRFANQPSTPSSSSLTPSTQATTCTATTEWPGFSSIKYIFSFGDSFTTTWFNWHDNPPSPPTPLGNPEYPGFTSASGANWIDLLTVKYNQSFLQTYNLAIGGAAVDQDIQLAPPLFGSTPFEPDRRSLKDQVQRDFITGYAYKIAPQAPEWNGGNALFTIWIGINDVVGSYARGPDGPEGTKELNKRIFATYTRLIEMMYDHGARNFVFLNVPAVDRSPIMVMRGPRDVAWSAADLTEFNGMIVAMAGEFKQKHPEVNAWVYDSRADFGKVLDDPRAFPQTSGLKNVTDACAKYGEIWPIPNQDLFNPECGVRLVEYFWRDGLHPTSPIHEVVAEQVAKMLQAAPTVCNSTTKSIR